MNGMTILAYDYPVLGAFWTILFLAVGVMWLILLFRVVADIFHDHTLGGPGKTIWLIFVMFLPFLGVFLYLLARGAGMNERTIARVGGLQSSRSAPGPTTSAGSGAGELDELVKLADLKAHGDISEAEYERAKEKILH